MSVEPLHDFYTDTVHQITDFCHWWTERSNKDSKQYPQTMESAEWEDQFESWKELYWNK